MSDITQKIVKEYLDYNLDTGVFTWIKNPSIRHNYIGRVAGREDKKGYRGIGLFGNQILAHRLAILYVTGSFPEKGKVVDHIDQNPKNNKYCNLRVVNYSTNGKNTRKRSNKFGYKNIQQDKRTGRYQVKISVNGTRKHIGNYGTVEEAIISAKNAVAEFDSHV